MYKFFWQDIETYSYTCFILISTVCLANTHEFVSHRCYAIFLTGNDCGVGYGRLGLAAGYIVIGMFSVWKISWLVRTWVRSWKIETV